MGWMEGNRWRRTQGKPTPMRNRRSGDWRTQLQPELRQRIVNDIVGLLMRHLPIDLPVHELQNVIIRFEEKMYTTATNQAEYFRKISRKLQIIVNEIQHPRWHGEINRPINQNPVSPSM